MNRVLSFATCLLVAGCAASGAGEPGISPDGRTVVSGDSDGRTVHVVRDEGTLKAWLDAPPEKVWPHLPAVYTELGLDRSTWSGHNPAERFVEVNNHRARRLAEQPISRFVNCGHSMGVPKTSTDQIYIHLKSWLEPANGGTNVNTRFEARARSTGASSNITECGSIGTLERQIAERLQRRLVESRS